MMETVCPPGFDCQAYSTCPNAILACPDGFFCSSYAGSPYELDLDFQYATMVNLGTSVTITSGNQEQYVDQNRSIQSHCLAGFYCPNVTTILPCPSSHWCPERSVTPHKCDPLSICPEQSYYQVNFVNTLIMAILMVITIIASTLLKRNQVKADERSRKHDPSTRTILQASADPIIQAAESVISSEFKNGYVEITFRNIVLQYSRTILPNVSGKIPAGKITAILGPTSSGKSSLLNILRVGGTDGKYSQGEVQVRIRNLQSGRTWSIDKASLSNYVGHVPQEDVFDRDLTVRELLIFNALTRTLATSTTKEEINLRVDETLTELSIQHIADAIIGGGENQAANISGGQLKRVNIACELVSLQKPGILLLDEPTNGLDASVAYELMESLEMVRDRGFTIVLVIQQPRAEIFSKFQHLFLMNAVGGIVFEGRSSAAVPYLTSLGYCIGEETSEADFCVDVLNGLNDTIDRETGEKLLEANQLHAIWKKATEDERPNAKTLEFLETGEKEDEEPRLSTRKYSSEKQESSFQYWSGVFWTYSYLTYLNAGRLLRIRLRNRSAIFVYFLIHIVMAIALSSGFSIIVSGTYLGVLDPPTESQFHPYYPRVLGVLDKRAVQDDGITQLMFFISSALGTASCLASVPVFAGKASMLSREKAGGMSVFAFGIGRVLGDLYFVILNGFVFAGVWCAFGHPGSYYYWMAVILSTAFASSGIGYICGAAISKNSANVFAIIFCFICCVFAGVEPTLRQVNRYPVVNWPWYLSFATWTAEVTYYTWSYYLTDFNTIDISLQDGANQFGFDISHGVGRSVGALMALGVGMRIIAILIMWRKTM